MVTTRMFKVAWYGIVLMPACGGGPPARATGLEVHGGARGVRESAQVDASGPLDASVSDQTRGMEVKLAPLVLDVALHVHGSRDGVLPDGSDVKSGDQMQVEVTTSVDARLHVAYCDKSQQLTLFPKKDGILVTANKPAFAPSQTGYVVLDNNTGPEALYVIVSHLAGDDPRLARAIAANRPGGDAADCGERIRGAVVVPVMAGVLPARRFIGGAKPMPRLAPGGRPQPGVRGVQTAGEDGKPREVGARARKHPAPTVERGAFVVFQGDVGVAAGADADGNDDGIVILRYGLNHL